jgi:hypothetical protein
MNHIIHPEIQHFSYIKHCIQIMTHTALLRDGLQINTCLLANAINLLVGNQIKIICFPYMTSTDLLKPLQNLLNIKMHFCFHCCFIIDNWEVYDCRQVKFVNMWNAYFQLSWNMQIICKDYFFTLYTGNSRYTATFCFHKIMHYNEFGDELNSCHLEKILYARVTSCSLTISKFTCTTS